MSSAGPDSGAGAAARCPSCSRHLPAGAPDRPFCSTRCKMVDLGRWLNEEYKVAGESAIAFDENLGEELAGPYGAGSGWEESGDERDA